jgi:hypothetical protein
MVKNKNKNYFAFFFQKMSHWNCWMAFTNMIAFFPLLQSRNDKWTFIAIGFAAGASFTSHLFQSHKHGMVGFNCNPKISYILDCIDIFCAILLIVRIFYILQWSILIQFIMPISICGLFNLVSEYDKSEKSKRFFLLTHSIWHISIFTMIHFLLLDVYKNEN